MSTHSYVCGAAEAARRVTRRVAALVAVMSALFVAVLSGGTEVSAHAYLKESSPMDGATLPSAPTSVTLRFVEPVVPDSIWIEVRQTEPEEADVALDASDVSADDGKQVVQPLPGDLGLGTYELQWAVVSSVDGHPSMGTVTFEVTGFVSSGTTGRGQGAGAGAFRWADVLPLIARWLSYAGVFVFSGMSLLAWRLGATSAAGSRAEAPSREPFRDPSFARELRRRGRRLGVISLVVGAAGWFGNLSWSTNLSLLSVALLRHSPFQLIAVSATLALVALALVFWWAERGEGNGARAERRAPKPLALAPAWTVIGFVLLLSFALGGHAAAVEGPRLSAVLMDWVHLGAAAAWLGGMAYLLLAVIPAWKATGRGAEAAGREAPAPGRVAADRFTAIALVSIGALIVTGIFSAELRFESVAAVSESLYGRSLLVKLAAFALMGAAAWVHHQLLRPRVRSASDGSARSWRAAIAAEALLGAVVVGAVAFMVTYPVPQREQNVVPGAIPEGTGRSLTLAENAGRLLVTATGYPLERGENVFRVRVSDPYDTRLRSEQVDLRIEVTPGSAETDVGDTAPGASERRTLRVVREDDGSFTARARLSGEGLWRLVARVSTPDVSGAETSFVFPVPVPDAKVLLDRAADVMEGMTDYKIRERLSDGMTTLHNVYELSGDKRMKYYVEGGLEIVFTERMRYTKPPGPNGTWVSAPAPEERLGLIRYLRDAVDVRAARTVSVDGVPTFEVHFFDERIRSRMAVWLEVGSYVPVKLDMMYPGHYMEWEFYDFGVPNDIEVPATASPFG